MQVDVLELLLPLPLLVNPVGEDVKQRLVVDEFRRVGSAEASEGSEHLALDVAGQVRVVPESIEPHQKTPAFGGVAHLQVEFDVGRDTETESATGQVGTADHSGCATRAGGVIQLAV